MSAENMVLIDRGVLAAAVYAIVNKLDAPKTVEAIRDVYLAAHQAPAPAAAVDRQAPKHHEIAQAVNALRDVALKYHATQQLREQIAWIAVPLMKRAAVEPTPTAAERQAMAQECKRLAEAYATASTVDEKVTWDCLDRARKMWAARDALNAAIDALVASQPAATVPLTAEAIIRIYHQTMPRQMLGMNPTISEHVAPFVRAIERAHGIGGEKTATVPQGWQPIETAPKDGTHLLCTTDGFQKVRIGWFYNGAWRWDGDYHGQALKPPSAWMPLPAPPSQVVMA